MPYTDSQVRLFAAAAHNKAISQKRGIPQGTARKMEMEAGKKQRSRAMKSRHPAVTTLDETVPGGNGRDRQHVGSAMSLIQMKRTKAETTAPSKPMSMQERLEPYTYWGKA